MFDKLKYCLLTFVFAQSVYSENKFFKPCKVSSPNFNACLKETGQKMVELIVKGEPELKLQGFKSHPIEDIVSSVGSTLKFTFTNCLIYGPENIKISDLKVNPDKKKIILTYDHNGYMVADYNLEGRLIILPVAGRGKSNITLGDCHYIYDIDYDIIRGKDGVDHWKIQKHQVTYSPSFVRFEFENLFNGNKQLSDSIHRFANDNWKELFTEIGPAFGVKITNRIVKEIGRFFAAIPASDMIES